MNSKETLERLKKQTEDALNHWRLRQDTILQKSTEKEKKTYQDGYYYFLSPQLLMAVCYIDAYYYVLSWFDENLEK